MRALLGYVSGALVSALVATIMILGTVGTPFLARALNLPLAVGALVPELAIQARALSKMTAGGGLPIAALLIFTAATAFFLVMNWLGLALFHATNSAWRSEPAWEHPKPVWCFVLFALMTTTLFLGLQAGFGFFDWLRLDTLGVGLAAGAGGLAFGLLQPKDLPIEVIVSTTRMKASAAEADRTPSSASVISTRRVNGVLGR